MQYSRPGTYPQPALSGGEASPASPTSNPRSKFEAGTTGPENLREYSGQRVLIELGASKFEWHQVIKLVIAGSVLSEFRTVQTNQSQESLLAGIVSRVIEQDHRRIKQRVRPMLGFKRFETATVIIRKCGPGSWRPEAWKIVHPTKTYTYKNVHQNRPDDIKIPKEQAII